MCHSCENNNKVNGLYERCLRIIYNDKRSSFNAFLEKDGFVSIHERNLKFWQQKCLKLAKIFKSKDQPQYNLRYNSLFSRYLVKSIYKGTESLSFLGPKIWDILPDTYKDLPDFKQC